MPGKKKDFFGLLISIIGIIGSLSFFLNSYFSHNNSSLEKQEKIINNELQENNNHQEEIADQENNAILLDNVINLIIFFLVFFVAVYFVYFSSLSPVVSNNSKDTIEDPTKKNNINESVFRRKVLFEESERFFREQYFYYLFDNDKLVQEKKEDKNKNINNKKQKNQNFKCLKMRYNCQYNRQKDDADLDFEHSKFSHNFKPEKYHGKIFKCKKEIKRTENLRYIKQYSYLPYSSYYLKIEKFFNDSFKNKIALEEHDLDDKNNAQSVFFKNICDQKEATYKKYFDHFKGTLYFFDSSNILAALLSYGFFLLFFLILYFFYAFICCFFLNEEELKEEENKFLLAFYRTLRMIVFFNLRSFLKIIPILCFSGVLIFDGYLFFGKSIKFIPFLYDSKTKKIMKFYADKNFFERGEANVLMDEKYESFYEEEDISDPNKKNE